MEDLVLVMSEDDALDLVLDEPDELELTIDSGEMSYPIYTGNTEFTPMQVTRVVFTAGKVVLDNIIINPIPSNYGLVTYQGNILTIS